MYKILLLTLLMACGDKTEDTGTDEAVDETGTAEEGSDTGSAEE